MNRKWEEGIEHEIEWWEHAFKEALPGVKEGKKISEEYSPLVKQLDPNLPVHNQIYELLETETDTVKLLDVGSGPYTWVGFKHHKYKISVTAVDALAVEYSELLRKYDINPPISTGIGYVERLTEKFDHNSFDCVVTRNSLDHSASPIAGIINMLAVSKPIGNVIILGGQDVGREANYIGFHQWNFKVFEGDVSIRYGEGTVVFVSDIVRGVGYIKGVEKLSHNWFRLVLKKF